MQTQILNPNPNACKPKHSTQTQIQANPKTKIITIYKTKDKKIPLKIYCVEKTHRGFIGSV